MRTHKLLLTSALALLLLGSAACDSGDDMSGSAVQTEGDTGIGSGDEPEQPQEPREPENPDDPSKPNEPEEPGEDQPGGDDSQRSGATSLDEALGSHGATERLAKEIIEDDCGDNPQCLQELDALVEYIEGDCGGDGCPSNVENFLQELTSAQRQGVIPATFPQTRDLVEVVEQADSAKTEDGEDESKGDEPGDEPADDPESSDEAAKDSAVANLVDALGNSNNTVTWDDIVGLISVDTNLPEKSDELIEEIREELEAAFATDDSSVAKALLEGSEVDPADAAAAIESAWAERSGEG